MSALSDALRELDTAGILDRVVKLDVGADGVAKLEMLPKIATIRERKKLPGEGGAGELDQELLYGSS